MLYLTRKVGESVIINDDIEVTVVEVRGRSIKLGFTFPSHVSVLRREIFERIQEENRAAAEMGREVEGPLPTISPASIGPSQPAQAASKDKGGPGASRSGPAGAADE